MTDAWLGLAEEYARNRIGYSPEVYDTIAQFGVRPGASVLDVGCGTGIASAPFEANGFPVTGVDPSDSMLAKARESHPRSSFVKGSAESLPFPNERFEVAVSAQAFHWLDRARALEEMYRVLRAPGIVAIWWKQLSAHDPLVQMRTDTFRALGITPPDPQSQSGFKEFYAGSFADQTLRVIPWRTAVSLGQYIGYERSRCSLREDLGSRAQEYYAELEARMRERYGFENPAIPLAYVHFLYLARKR